MTQTTAKDVKVIRPTKGLYGDKKLRVAAYCRVSTSSDDQENSFIAQVKYYNDYLRLADNMELVDIYADEGITGTSVNKREDFNRMIRDSSLGKIDRIFVKSVLIIKSTYNKLLELRKSFFNNSSAIEDIDNELAELAEQNAMYVRFHSQKIIDEITFMEQTSEIKQRINELRSRRIKLISENEEERCIKAYKDGTIKVITKFGTETTETV